MYSTYHTSRYPVTPTRVSWTGTGTLEGARTLVEAPPAFRLEISILSTEGAGVCFKTLQNEK